MKIDEQTRRALTEQVAAGLDTTDPEMRRALEACGIAPDASAPSNVVARLIALADEADDDESA